MRLAELHLLVTRPTAQAIPWSEKLMALGASVNCQPMLTIEPLKDAGSQQKIKQQILQLDKYQKGIFVSQNAVGFGVDWIDQYWPQLPSGLDLFAIGGTTKALLENKLMALDSAIAYPRQAMNSEDLLSLDELNAVSGESIIIFRGQGGRTYLGECLKERGAFVDYCELYQRLIPPMVDQQQLKEFRQTCKIPVTVVHSGETLSNLCTLVKDDLPWFKQQALLVPGHRVAQQAKTLDFQQIIIADNATHESMTEALHDWRQ